PLESPLLPKDVSQGKPVGSGWYTVETVERAHDRPGAPLYGGMERRQIPLPQRALGNLSRVVISAGFGGSVSNKVLHASQDGLRIVQARALISAHIGGCHGGAEIRIFSC